MNSPLQTVRCPGRNRLPSLTWLAALLGIRAVCGAGFDDAGDRHPEIRLSFPESGFFHAGKGGRLIDVTKPPFNAKGDGKTDDTGALVAALDYVQRVRREAYCGRRLDVGSHVLYLPDGTYRVTDTVQRSLPVLVGAPPYDQYRQWWVMDERELDDHGRFPVGRFSNEQNDTIVILGQSRGGTSIRLDDNCAGFGAGQSKPVLTFFRLACGSNVNQDNVLENLTIDTGRGNPGAVAVRWNSSNTGAIRNATIRSADGAGAVGLLCDVRNAQGLVENVSIDGFDEGFVLTAGCATAMTIEGATFRNQRKQAVRVANASNLSARRVCVETGTLGLKVESAAHVVLLDSEVRCAGGRGTAVEIGQQGHLLARALGLRGGGATIARDGAPLTTAAVVREFVSGPIVAVDDARPPSLAESLPVEESPLVMPSHGADEWANVDEFGASGDGDSDDTAAIQRAMDSGRPAVLFPREAYVINGTVRIPKTVKKIDFVYGKTLRAQPAERAMFCVAEPSAEPLLIERNINMGGVLLDHDADRPVVLADATTYFPHAMAGAGGIAIMPHRLASHDPKSNCWRLYRNTSPELAPKKLFVNNCVNFAPGGPGAMHAVERVHAWCRQVNTEHYGVDLAFRRSTVWVLGFKTEMDGTHFWVEDGSALEVLGGVYYQGGPDNRAPVVAAKDSAIRVTMSSFGGGGRPSEILLEDQRGRTKTVVGRERFRPLRPSNPEMPVVPLLVN